MTPNAIYFQFDPTTNAYIRHPAHVLWYRKLTTVQPGRGDSFENVEHSIADLDVDYGNVIGEPGKTPRVLSVSAHLLKDLRAQRGRNYYELLDIPATPESTPPPPSNPVPPQPIPAPFEMPINPNDGPPPVPKKSGK